MPAEQHASVTQYPDLIVFDLGCVLVDVDFSRFTRAVCHDEESAERAASVVNSEMKRACDRGELTPHAFAAQAIKACELRVDVAAFLAAWVDIFEPFGVAEQVIQHLAEHAPLWLLSDTDPAHFGYLREKMPCLRRFERFELSYERGVMKRDAGAFEFLRERAERERVAFVDDIEAHTSAAAAVGCEGVWFRGWESQLPGWLSPA